MVLLVVQQQIINSRDFCFFSSDLSCAFISLRWFSLIYIKIGGLIKAGQFSLFISTLVLWQSPLNPTRLRESQGPSLFIYLFSSLKSQHSSLSPNFQLFLISKLFGTRFFLTGMWYSFIHLRLYNSIIQQAYFKSIALKNHSNILYHPVIGILQCIRLTFYFWLFSYLFF